MWKKWLTEDKSVTTLDYRTDDYKALLKYVNKLASHKLGYPVSLLTYLGIVDNNALGIKTHSIANVLLNNVGDPFKDSETSLLEVKKHEREVIRILEKFYGLEPGEVRGYVTTGGTEGNFASLWWSKRYLINCNLEKLIAYDDKIKSELKEEQELIAALAKIPTNDFENRANHLQKIMNVRNSIIANKSIVQEILTPTVFYSKGHTHYSIPKIAEILHLNIKAVEPDIDGSMDMNAFKKDILLHLYAHPHSSIIAIANIGTTITGAIDNVPEIKKIIETSNPRPYYTIHMDGALTGFVLPIIKPFGDVKDYFSSIGVNTLAVSAHKYPGLSQPCGIILAQKDFFNKAFEKSERSIEYVGNILDYTISGSRSGLNVLMFYNSLRTLGMDKGNEKLIKMVNENMQHAKYLYDELVKIYGYGNVYYPFHFNVMFPKPSKDMARKYQLMITSDRATICVLSNVTKRLIDEFIVDLKHDKETNMNTSTTKADYTKAKLSKEHMEQTIKIFVKSFCDSEPITKHLNISYEEYEKFATEVINKAVQDELSSVLLDKDGNVIACNISEDIANPFIPHAAEYPILKPVFALLEKLSRPFMQGRIFKPGKILHVWIAAVDPAYRGQGLSTIVDMASIENGAHKGFEFAYAEFTNELSEKVTSQFKVLFLNNKIAFDDFTMDDGKRPFQGLRGAATAYLATLRPGIKIESLETCYTNVDKAIR